MPVPNWLTISRWKQGKQKRRERETEAQFKIYDDFSYTSMLGSLNMIPGMQEKLNCETFHVTDLTFKQALSHYAGSMSRVTQLCSVCLEAMHTAQGVGYGI